MGYNIAEDYESEKQKFGNFGATLVDEKEMNNYVLFLLEGGGFYQMGLTHKDNNVISPESQIKLKYGAGGKEFTIARFFYDTVKEWVNEYGMILVGSFNPDKTHSYHNILTRLGLNTTPIQSSGGQEYFFVKPSNNIVNEDFDNEINYLNQHGYKLIDKVDVNNYTLFLVKEPHEGLYEIGITSNNRGFTTPQSQAKITGSGDGREFSTAKGFKTTIDGWLSRYSPIYVGSLNKNKTTKYHNILNRLGFNVGEVNYDQPVVVGGNEVFPESWNFIISKKKI